MPMKIGLTNTGPATAVHLSSSWKQSISNGYRSQLIKRLCASGRFSKTNSVVKTPSFSTPNSHPSTDCKLLANPTSPPSAASNAKLPYELIRFDLSANFSVQSLGKLYYYLSPIDDKTRFTWVRFLREKSDAINFIKGFVKERKTQPQMTTDTIISGILHFRTDGGGECVNKELYEYLESEGMIHEMSPPYSHESNGLSICLDGDVPVIYSASILRMGPHGARRKAASVHLAQCDWPPYTKTLHGRMARAKRHLHSLLYEAELYISKMQC